MIWKYLLKLLISSVLIVLISETSKKSSLLGSILASLPIVSLLAIVWLYIETKSVQVVSALSKDIFWLVLPSLAFFWLFPYFLKHRWGFTVAMLVSIGITVILYLVTIFILHRTGQGGVR